MCRDGGTQRACLLLHGCHLGQLLWMRCAVLHVEFESRPADTEPRSHRRGWSTVSSEDVLRAQAVTRENASIGSPKRLVQAVRCGCPCFVGILLLPLCLHAFQERERYLSAVLLLGNRQEGCATPSVPVVVPLSFATGGAVSDTGGCGEPAGTHCIRHRWCS